MTGETPSFAWTLPGPANGQFSLQTTTNLSDWIDLSRLTNSGSGYLFWGNPPASVGRFFRIIPSP